MNFAASSHDNLIYIFFQSYRMEMFFRTTWNDSSLCHNETEELIYPEDSGSKFWRPNIYFNNALTIIKHEAPESVRFIKIYPNGTILTSSR